MTDRYVASALFGGSDGASGLTQLTAWATLAKVQASSAASDHVKGLRGAEWLEYPNGNATTQTWEAYGAPADDPVQNRPRINAMTVVSGTWTSTTPANTWSITFGSVFPTTMAVNNSLYRPAASQAALTPGRFFWAAGVLYICIVGGSAAMTGFVIETNGARNGCWRATTGTGGFTLQDWEFKGGYNGTVNLNAMNASCLVQRCTFRLGGFTTSVAMLFIADGAGAIGGHKVLNCLCKEAITDHIFFTDSPNCEVGYCVFLYQWGSVSDHIQFSGAINGSGGGNVHHCYSYIQPTTDTNKGMIVQGATVTTGGAQCKYNVCDGGNFMFSFGGTGETGFNNHDTSFNTHFNGLAGSSVASFGDGGLSNNCNWSFNVSINCAYMGFNWFGNQAHNNVTVYCNTVYGAAFRAAGTGGSLNTISGTFKLNIFHAIGSSHHYRIDGGGITSDYNCIPNVQFSFIFWNTTGYSTLETYQAASSQDAHSFIDDPLLEDTSSSAGQIAPFFNESLDTFWIRAMNTAKLNFKSPCIDAGIVIGGVTLTYSGSAPDIGAVEANRYFGYSILDFETPVLIDDVEVSITRGMDIFLPSTGIASAYTDTLGPVINKPVRFILDGRASIDAFKNFIDGVCEGMAGAFWIPTYQQDFTLNNDVTGGDTTIVTLLKNYGSLVYPSGNWRRHLSIRPFGGTPMYRKVTAVSATSTTETLTLSSSIPASYKKENLFLSYLTLVRLDSDEVSYRWLNQNVVEITLSLSELPLEVP